MAGWNMPEINGISKYPIRSGRNIREIHPVYGILEIGNSTNNTKIVLED